MKRFGMIGFLSFWVFTAWGQSPEKTYPSPSMIVRQAPLTTIAETMPGQAVETGPYRKIYNASLGVFCKTENKVRQSVQFPVKIRLGTSSYVDKIEGK